MRFVDIKIELDGIICYMSAIIPHGMKRKTFRRLIATQLEDTESAFGSTSIISECDDAKVPRKKRQNIKRFCRSSKDPIAR